MSSDSGIQPRVLVVVPAYNEAASITTVVRDIRRAAPQADVLVVDDGSSDNTAALARSADAMVASLPFNLGVGGAMRTGYRFALRQGYTAVVQVDGDGQHDATHILRLTAALDHADIAVGSRFSGGYAVSGPRLWAMQGLSAVMTRLLKVPIDDTTSGFRAAGPAAIRVWAEHYPAEYLGDTLEALVIAHKSALRIKQVPVAMRPRATGRPSRNPVEATFDLARAGILIVLGLVRDWPIPQDRAA